MPNNYTPVVAWGTDPIAVPVATEAATAATIFAPVYTALDRIAFLKDAQDTNKGLYDAALLKLGITVASPADTTPPTYGGSPFVLTGSRTHQNALETLDATIETNSVALGHAATNLGGNVLTGSPDSYTSTTIITNGDPHHTALGKIDAAVAVVDTAASAASSASALNTTKITNIVTKLGALADDAAAWVYTSTVYIANSQTLKTNVETLDQATNGSKRNAHYSFAKMVAQEEQLRVLTETITNTESFYDDFYDNSKVDGVNTTATVDTLKQEARGDSTVLVEQFIASVTQTQIRVGWEGTAGVTVKVNLIGSVTPGDFETVASKDTWVTPTSGGGTGIVVQFELGVSAKLYNFYIVTKP